LSKTGLIVGGIGAAVIIGIIASYSITQFGSETINLDMGRTHGTISTAMGSPLLGNPSAPVTIVEFGDYQCSQCYIWFQNTKPQIIENLIDTGKSCARVWFNLNYCIKLWYRDSNLLFKE